MSRNRMPASAAADRREIERVITARVFIKALLRPRAECLDHTKFLDKLSHVLRTRTTRLISNQTLQPPSHSPLLLLLFHDTGDLAEAAALDLVATAALIAGVTSEQLEMRAKPQIRAWSSLSRRSIVGVIQARKKSRKNTRQHGPKHRKSFPVW